MNPFRKYFPNKNKKFNPNQLPLQLVFLSGLSLILGLVSQTVIAKGDKPQKLTVKEPRYLSSPKIDYNAFVSGSKTKKVYDAKLPGCIKNGKKWELTSKDCESLLPNIHYSDKILNEQIADYRVALEAKEDKNYTANEKYIQIDHLIYPTIGAPNLFFKGSKRNDELVVLLSVDFDKYIVPLFSKLATSQDSASRLYLYRKSVPKEHKFKGLRPNGFVDGSKGIFIYLTARDTDTRKIVTAITKQTAPKSVYASFPLQASAGATVEGQKVYRIQPNGFWKYGRPNTKGNQAKHLAPLMARAKIKLIFTEEQLRHVPPGFYDIRIDIIHGNAAEEVKVTEFQYNAVRIYKEGYENLQHNILNVTDSQISLGHNPVTGNGKPDKGKDTFRSQTLKRVKQFVSYLNHVYSKETPNKKLGEDKIQNSAFITFNGDVHNGGAPLMVTPTEVVPNYNHEAIHIINILKQLPLPIFLTAGNHDGYVAMGHIPVQLPKALGDASGFTIDKAVEPFLVGTGDINSRLFPNFVNPVSLSDYKFYLDKTKDYFKGGLHVDIFTGSYIRSHAAQSYSTGWQSIKETWLDDQGNDTGIIKRNFVAYDGFNQWRKVYGPLYQSWTYAGNQFINLNSYELRQHMRSGWGMYTVNYGGGISSEQYEWAKHQTDVADQFEREIVLLAHHDPRGGHRGVNQPFYFAQTPYDGMGQVAKAFALGELALPKICGMGLAPKLKGFLGTEAYLKCLQDGLQEWMRADSEFDCEDWQKYSSTDQESQVRLAMHRQTLDEVLSDPDGVWYKESDSRKTLLRDTLKNGKCDISVFAGKIHKTYSGYNLIDLIATHAGLRTLLLGHTHYNSVEVIAPNHAIVHSAIVSDQSVVPLEGEEKVSKKGLFAKFKDVVNSINPLRKKAVKEAKLRRSLWKVFFPKVKAKVITQGLTADKCKDDKMEKSVDCMVFDITSAGHSGEKIRMKDKGAGTELVVVRLTAVANLTEQTEAGNDELAFGFSVLHLNKQHKGPREKYAEIPRINEISFFHNRTDTISNLDGSFELHNKDPYKIKRDSVDGDPSPESLNSLFDSSKSIPPPTGNTATSPGGVAADVAE